MRAGRQRFFVFLIPLTRWIHASLVGWIVMLMVIGLPVVTVTTRHPLVGGSTPRPQREATRLSRSRKRSTQARLPC